MRVIKVKTPEGFGKKVAEIAFEAGISEVGIQGSKRLSADKKESHEEVVEMETATPKAKNFIDSLTVAPFYDPRTFSFTLEKPESLYGTELPSKVTKPTIRPTEDVYEELWQYNQITVSLLVRVFLSSLLLCYGMVHGYMPLIVAGLLFLPYHHHLLSIGLAGSLGGV